MGTSLPPPFHWLNSVTCPPQAQGVLGNVALLCAWKKEGGAEPPDSSQVRAVLPPDGGEKNAGWERTQMPNRRTPTPKIMQRNSLIHLLMLIKGTGNVLSSLEAPFG